MGKVIGRRNLARICGVTSDTIQWLEEINEISPGDIYVGGHRLKEYSAQDVKKCLSKTKDKRKTPA